MGTPSTTASDFDSCRGATARPIAFSRASSSQTRPARALRPILTLAALGAALLVLGFLAAPASADRAYLCQVTGSASPSATECNGTGNTMPGGPLSTPVGVAVDSSDNLWVTDISNGVVDKFDSTGNFLAQGGGPPFPYSGEYIESAAWNNAPGKLFVSDSGEDDLWGLNPDASYSGTDLNSGLGGGCCYIRVAADNSGSATDGNLYVSGVSGQVVRIDASGAAKDFSASASYISANKLTGTPGGGFEEPLAVAVDGDGFVYVIDRAKKTLEKFDPSGAFVQSFTGTGVPGGFGENLNGVAIDPTNGNILIVDQENNVVDEFDSSGAYIGQITGSPVPFGNLGGGIAVDSSGKVYLADRSNSVVNVFSHQITLPAITYQPNDPGHTSTTLHAEIDPNGGSDVTACRVDYGTDTSYGSGSVPCSPDPSTSPPGSNFSAPTDVSAHLSGLTNEASYHYRVVATNAEGTAFGSDQTFTTRNVFGLTTSPATEVKATSAVLNASFTGIGDNVHYYFEWGPDTSYGQKSATPPGADAGSPSGAQSLNFTLIDLTVDTTYHYRVVASSPAGTSFGADRTFTTLGRYQFARYLGAAGSGDGQLSSPRDVAVDQASGDVYVADTGNRRVVKFDSSGSFLAAWGWGVDDGSPASQVCTSGCQAGLSGSGAGQFTTPRFIEVDNSGSSAGDVYVGDTATGLVQRFSSTGALVTSWGTAGARNFSGGGTIGGIAVGNHGDLFVLTLNPPFYRFQIGPDGTYETKSPVTDGEPVGTGIDVDSFGTSIYGKYGDGLLGSPLGAPPTGVASDRSTNDFYVDEGSQVKWFAAVDGCRYYENYFFGKPLCPPTDVIGLGDLTETEGLTFDLATTTLYVANRGENNVAIFSALPLPQVTTGPPTDVDGTSASIGGTVDPKGGTVTDCYFEWGPTAGYTSGTVPCSPATPFSSVTDVSADLTSLTPFATYHYRLVAVRADGEGYPAYGSDQTVTPAPGSSPTIGASSVDQLTPTSAELKAQVNPRQAPTVFRIQYGPSDQYGSQTSTSEPIGEDENVHEVTSSITGLTPGSTYHFRVLATNFNGTTAGPDQTFSTPALPTLMGAAATSITQTTATLGAEVNPGFSPAGYRIEYGTSNSYGNTLAGSPVGADNSFHPVAVGVAGLAPATTYHFRVVATNGVGQVDSGDQMFTTAPSVSKPDETGKQAKCKRGFRRKKGKCVKKRRKAGAKHKSKPKHHRRGAH